MHVTSSTRSILFRHPEPSPASCRIYPVFIPFMGCRQRCLYCAQEKQTGSQAALIPAILESAGRELERSTGGPWELAFYGGTFTSLPDADLEYCLDFVRQQRERGRVGAVRCSTRPDAVGIPVLSRLVQAGFTAVELGVQSFSSAALTAAQRGYDRETALRACAAVRQSGLSLGIQLMPGMPGVDQPTAGADVALAASLGPDFVRLYPCLVIEGTPLAGEWRRGAYQPWKMEETLDFLARSSLLFWRKNIRIIRMGLAPQADLSTAVLAGPMHPSLGNRVRARALARYIRQRLSSLLPGADSRRTNGFNLWLQVPRRYQGEFWGHKKELMGSYQEMGLPPKAVRWHDREEFILGMENQADSASNAT